MSIWKLLVVPAIAVSMVSTTDAEEVAPERCDGSGVLR